MIIYNHLNLPNEVFYVPGENLKKIYAAAIFGALLSGKIKI